MNKEVGTILTNPNFSGAIKQIAVDVLMLTQLTVVMCSSKRKTNVMCSMPEVHTS